MATQINPAALTGIPGIARRLVIEGVLAEDDARKAVDASNKQKVPLVSYLVQNGLAPSVQVANAASAEFGIPLFDVRSLDLRIAPIKLLVRSIEMEKLAPRVQAALDGGEQSIRNAMLSVADEFGLKI